MANHNNGKYHNALYVNLTDVYGSNGWEPATLADGFRYGAWEQASDGEYIVPNYLSGSDYSGTLVERSNHDVWCETFADGLGVWWTDVSGGHGTFAIVARVADMPEDAHEFLAALEEYPLADESHHSNLEMEKQNEAWEDTYRRDFVRALEGRIACELVDDDDADEITLDDVPTSEIDRLFWELFRNGDLEWINEQGDSMYLDVERAADRVTDDELRALAGPPYAPMYDHPVRQLSLPL